MTIADRIRGTRRPVRLSQIVTDIANRDIAAIGRDAADVVRHYDDVRAAAAGAFEHLQSLASDAASTVGDTVDQAGDDASKAVRDFRFDKLELPRIDVKPDELVERLRRSLPTDRIAHLVENLERELPNTDKGRYDRAYSRGWARARTAFVVVGAAAGIAAGVAGAYLLDPVEGPRRRAALKAKARATGNTVSTKVSRTASVTTERARSLAAERGMLKGDADELAASGPSIDTTPTEMIAVMDIEPVVPPIGTGDSTLETVVHDAQAGLSDR